MGALDESEQTVFEPDANRLQALAGGAAHAPGGSLPPGTLLNHIYEVRRFLARGGMGEVYEGRNVNTDERVAVKLMLPHLAADAKMQALFRKEARILTELAHPALVRYRVLAEEPQLKLLYIVTEFIDGPPLSDTIGRQVPEPAAVGALARRLAEGLAAAHALGAIHRDLSPDNVLLPAGRLELAKIIDFGIARSTELGQQTLVADTFAGKLGYVAPEQFGDFGREIGPWTDVYSLGLTLLAVATGRAPDLGSTLVEAVERRRKGVDLSAAPAALKPLLQKMLAPDPARRLRNMDEVIAALNPRPDPPVDALPQAAPAATVFGRRQSEPLPPSRGETSRPPITTVPPRPTTQVSAPLPHLETPKRRLWPWLAGAAVVTLGGAITAAMILSHRPAPAARAPVPSRLVILAQPAPSAPAAATSPSAAPESATPPVQATTAAPQIRPTAPVLRRAASPTIAPKTTNAPAAPDVGENRPAAPAAAQPAPAASAQAQPEAAQPDPAVQACWRAAAGHWIYLGYASRSTCAAQVFHGSCQTVYGRWGQRQLRRYDGKLQIESRGLFSHWSSLGASDCPTAPEGGSQ